MEEVFDVKRRVVEGAVAANPHALKLQCSSFSSQWALFWHFCASRMFSIELGKNLWSLCSLLEHGGNGIVLQKAHHAACMHNSCDYDL